MEKIEIETGSGELGLRITGINDHGYEWEDIDLKPNTKYIVQFIEVPEGWRMASEKDIGKFGRWLSEDYTWSVVEDILDDPQEDGMIYITRDASQIELTCKINGKESKLSDISEETLLKIRKEEK